MKCLEKQPEDHYASALGIGLAWTFYPRESNPENHSQPGFLSLFGKPKSEAWLEYTTVIRD